MRALFWGSLLLVGYAYLGYLACLWVLRRLRRGPALGAASGELPRVTLLISAYNEEGVIGEKLKNSLSIDYPGGLLEIVVVSDASDDGTDEIARAFAPQGVRLVRTVERGGKSAGLNHGVAAATGEILVFSDANSLYERQSLRELVLPFGDPQVGFVTGGTSYRSDGDEGLQRPVSLYASLEQRTKLLESAVGSCVGADGAMFAVRRGFWRPLRPQDLNDLVVPLEVVRRGLRGVYQPGARCLERTAKSVGGEFNRQVRITGRTLRALVGSLDLLNPVRHGLFAWELLSHKWCKLLVPFALVVALAANLALAPGGWPWTALLALQVAAYAAGGVGLLFQQGGRGGPLSLPAVFLASSAAILLGWLRFLQGETYTTWSTSR